MDVWVLWIVCVLALALTLLVYWTGPRVFERSYDATSPNHQGTRVVAVIPFYDYDIAYRTLIATLATDIKPDTIHCFFQTKASLIKVPPSDIQVQVHELTDLQDRFHRMRDIEEHSNTRILFLDQDAQPMTHELNAILTVALRHPNHTFQDGKVRIRRRDLCPTEADPKWSNTDQVIRATTR